jgi:WD40 repeat protein
LASAGGYNGKIKLWNVKAQASIHVFDHGGDVTIRALFFAGGTDSACVVVTHAMSVIRLWKAEGTSDFASETIREADRGGAELHRAALSPSGSLLATSFHSRTRNVGTVALYELETMTNTRSVVMPGFIPFHIAVTSDSKQLVVVDQGGRVRLLQTDDLSIQRNLVPRGETSAMPPVWSVAFDPTCRFLAFGCQHGRLELRSL